MQAEEELAREAEEEEDETGGLSGARKPEGEIWSQPWESKEEERKETGDFPGGQWLDSTLPMEWPGSNLWSGELDPHVTKRPSTTKL